jgi:hypothetical protein
MSAKPLVFPHFGARVAARNVALGERPPVDADTLARSNRQDISVLTLGDELLGALTPATGSRRDKPRSW